MSWFHILVFVFESKKFQFSAQSTRHDSNNPSTRLGDRSKSRFTFIHLSPRVQRSISSLSKFSFTSETWNYLSSGGECLSLALVPMLQCSISIPQSCVLRLHRHQCRPPQQQQHLSLHMREKSEKFLRSEIGCWKRLGRVRSATISWNWNSIARVLRCSPHSTYILWKKNSKISTLFTRSPW